MDRPTLTPEGNVSVPTNAAWNVSYTCTSSVTNVKIIWQINLYQIQTEEEKEEYANAGYLYIEDMNNGTESASSLTIAPHGRHMLGNTEKPIKVVCNIYVAKELRAVDSNKSFLIQYSEYILRDMELLSNSVTHIWKYSCTLILEQNVMFANKVIFVAYFQYTLLLL